MIRYSTQQKTLLTKMIFGVICFAVVLFGAVSFSSAQFNPTINYQGKLTTSTGVAVTDGTYQISFSLYTAPTGGVAVWTELLDGADEVTVTNGLFSVMLGSTTPLTSVDFNQTLYLGVTVEGDTEMTPRKVLGTVPAAFEADNAQTLDGIATTSFLRSDQADIASGLLTFTGGFISQASSTVTELTTLTSTTTDLYINGRLFDANGSAGTNGYVLQSTATGQEWVATSSLGFGTSNFSTAEIDTYAELDAIVADVTLTHNGLIDTSAELLAIVGDETGTGALVFGTSPTFTNQITSPMVVGGTGASSNLLLKSTSGVGTTDYIGFLVGNNGATEAGRFTSAGRFLIGTTSPAYSNPAVSASAATFTLQGSFTQKLGASSLTFLSETQGTVPGTTLNGAFGVAVSGKYAYVTSGNNNAFSVIDISNPTSPTYIAQTKGTVPDTTLAGAKGIAVAGKYAYVANQIQDSLAVIDISNPTSPVVVGETQGPTPGTSLNQAEAVAVSGKYAYVTSYSNDSLAVIDISDPANPTFIAQTQGTTPGTTLDGATGIFVSGKYAYVATQVRDSLAVIDISDPANPTYIAETRGSTPGTTLDGAFGVFVSGKYAYVTNSGRDSLAIIDISNPSSPTFIAETQGTTPGTTLDGARMVHVSGKYAYMTAGTRASLAVIDISNPASPVFVAETRGTTPGTTLNSAGTVFVSGKYAYVASNGNDSFAVIDLGGNDASTLLAGNTQTGSLNVTDLATFGGNISVAGGINAGQGFAVGGPSSIFYGTTTSMLVDLFSVGTAESNVLTVNSLGNVGIGTTTPTDLLTVAGSSYFGATSTFAGNVGIGTTTPSQELTVAGNARITGALYDSNNNAGTSGYVLQSTGTGQQWVATSSLGFGTSNFSVADIDTSAELLAIVGDETGTGALVFANSPTLTGTIDAVAGDFSSTLTMSGTAANIALGSNWLSGDGQDEGIFVDGSGRVGIGTSTPSTLLSLNADNPSIYLRDSTGGTPINVEIINSSSLLGFGILDQTNNREILFYEPAANTLTTEASLLIDTDTGSTPLRISRLGVTNEVLSMWVNDTSAFILSDQDENTAGHGNLIFQTDNDGSANGYFGFQTKSGSDLMRLTSAGDLGIGTTSPASKLDVWGDFRVGTSSIPTLVVDTSTGFVGIGTSSPIASLHVTGNAVIGREGGDAGGANSLSVGSSAWAYGPQSFAAGNAIANNYYSIALGNQSGAYGAMSSAIGYRPGAMGDYSIALGSAVAGSGYGGNGDGTHAMAIGLGDMTGERPMVTGTSSLGIFLGDQSGLELSTEQVMAIMGGSVGVGTLTPSQKLAVEGSVVATDAYVFADGSTQTIAGTQDGTAWSLNTAVPFQSFSVSSQDSLPHGLSFSPDGTKMYTIGDSDNEINEYTLGTAWNVSSAVFTQALAIGGEETSPRGLFFRPDGIKMYTTGNASDQVDEYTLGTAWDVSSASFLQSLSVSTEDGAPTGIFFRPDGKKLFVVGDGNNEINEYTLDTAWDVSSATFDTALSITTQDGNPQSVFFKPDGTHMYIVGDSGNEINEYLLSTPWSVSTASFLQVLAVGTEDTSPRGIFMKPDGTKMYITGDNGNVVYEYDLGLSVRGNVFAGLNTNANFGIGTTTPSQKLTVAGNARITGALYDSNNSAGTSGYVLQSTGTGQQWVATSSLGFGTSNFTAADIDTYSELDAIVADVTLTHNGLIDTSAELLAIVGDETGTGALVFANSPTLTGTIDAVAGDFSSTLTMSGTAANIALGSNYLTGDGTDGGILIESTGNVLFGGADVPELYFNMTSYDDPAIFTNNDYLAFHTGIGVTNGYYVSFFDNGADVEGYIGMDNDGPFNINTVGADLSLGTDSNSVLTIDLAGNVNIGVATSSSKLTVDGDIYTTGSLVFNADDASSGLYFPGDNYFARDSWNDTADKTGILMPMYIYPSSVYSNTDFNEVIELKNKYKNVPLYVILNPASGPGTVTDGNYTAAIQRLKGSGAIVLGYIATQYMASSTAEMASDIDTWLTLYPDIDGIFMDEMTNTTVSNELEHYATITRHAHGRGLYPVVGNPGSGVGGEYFASSTADIIMTVESGTYPTEASLKGDFDNGYADYTYKQRASAIYGQTDFSVASTTLLKKYTGLIYVTDDTLSPNPWDSVSSHLETLFEFLSSEHRRVFTDFYVDGNLGIGTTTPADLLTVAGTSYFGATSTFAGNVGIGTTTPSQLLTVAGNARITGALYDSNNSAGTSGYVLQSTATGQEWVATSTLGISGGLTAADIDTSAELLAIVTDETGTGNLVFSNAPAFSGTATFSALTATSTLTMSGTSANIALGSNFLSGDGGDEGIFLDANGDFTLTGASGDDLYIGMNEGSGYPTFFSNADVISFGANVEVLDGFELTLSDVGNDHTAYLLVENNGATVFGNSAGDMALLPTGNVGIGTSSPSQKLQVQGNLRLTGALYDSTNSAGTSGYVLQSTGTGQQWVATSTLGIGGGGLASTDIDTSAELLAIVGDETGTGALVFGTSPTFTTQITTPLIVGGTGTTQDLTFKTTSGVGATGADMHFLVGNNGATEAMTILNSGFVGIGGSSPSSLLHVSRGNSGDAVFTLEADADNNGTDDNAWLYITQDGGTTEGYLGTVGTAGTAFGGTLTGSIANALLLNVEEGDAEGTLQFATEDTVRMTIDFDGNVGIGTSDPSSRLHLEGGEIWAFNNAANPRMLLGDNTTSGQYGYLQWDSTNDYYRIETDGTNGLKIKGNNVAIGNIFPADPLTVGSGSTALMTVKSTGNVGIGTSTPSSLLAMGKITGLTGSVTAGIDQYFNFTNSTASAVYYGDKTYIVNAPTSASTLVGKMVRIQDSTALSNTVRGLEVQAHRGTNTQGENTALSGFARTFGVRGTTEGDAGGSFEPAGVFAETKGTTQGNAIRGYSGSITSADLLSLFQDTSAFTGTGILMNFGNSGGSFSSTTSKFVDFQNAGTSKFTVTAHGTTTIGDGTTNYQAGLQIGYGGLCVDNDGSCNASTTGKITSVSSAVGNSDLAEMYFGDDDLEPGDIIATAGILSIEKADATNSGNIIGVVSTKPGLTLGFDDTSLTSGQTGYPVALSGRVPIKLSTENGPIKKGDKIMLSSIAGVGMKATEGGVVVGTALEDFDGDFAYSEGFVDQFGDDIAEPNTSPLNVETDERIHDGCSFGGGGALGDEDEECTPRDTERFTTIETAVADRNAEMRQALMELAEEEAEEMETADGEVVYVGQALMFVNLGWHQTVQEQTVLAELTSTSTDLVLGSEDGEETLWSRLKTLAQGFVDGILSVAGLRAENVYVENELCVDGVCLNADDLRALLQEANRPSEGSGSGTPPPPPAPEPTEETPDEPIEEPQEGDPQEQTGNEEPTEPPPPDPEPSGETPVEEPQDEPVIEQSEPEPIEEPVVEESLPEPPQETPSI